MAANQFTGEFEAGHVLMGKYRLERTIARGGMGTVWKAKHLQLDTPVAVKVLAHNRLDSVSIRARFEGEARAAAMLKGKHIVTIHDFGVEDDVPFIVMELLEGEDLEDRLRRLGGIPIHESVRIVAEVCSALQKAHAAGLVHRDMKPSNIFLARSEEGESVKVVDFGVAKLPMKIANEESPTEVDEFLGSPIYMSPEQVRSARDVDARADLWSISVIIYRLLTGKLPFEGKTPGDLLVKVCTDPHTPPSQHHPHLPLGIDGFIQRALSKDPEDRFQNASELASSFADACGVARVSVPGLSQATTGTGSHVVPNPELSSDPFPSEAMTRKVIPQERTDSSSALPPRRTNPMRAGAILLAVGGILTLIWLIASSASQRDIPATAMDSSTHSGPPLSSATGPTPAPSLAAPASASTPAPSASVPIRVMPKPMNRPSGKRLDLGL
jgi:eukaryotic-like serine/threonine-protein kinase